MVNTKSLPPAVALLGEIEVIDGALGQEQDTPIASAITSTHKTDDLAAVAIGVRRWQTGSDKRGAGNLRAIREDRRHNRNLTTGRQRPTLIRRTCKGKP